MLNGAEKQTVRFTPMPAELKLWRARESLMAVDEEHETMLKGIIGAGAQECGTCGLLWQKEEEEEESNR